MAGGDLFKVAPAAGMDPFEVAAGMDRFEVAAGRDPLEVR